MKFFVIPLLFISTLTWAKTFDFSDRFGIGGGGGYTFPVTGNDFDDFADDEVMWGLHARYNLTAEDGMMLNYSIYEFENTPIGARVLDLMYINRLNEGDKMTPILGIGAGVADMHNIKPYHDGLKFASRARAGFEYSLTDDLVGSLFADFQFIGKMPFNSEDENTKDEAFPGREIFAVVPQIALTYYFGPDKEIPKHHVAPAVAVPADTSRMDDDHDGVMNSKDKCPGTEVGAKVNDYGCKEDETAEFRMNVLFPTGSYVVSGNLAPIREMSEFLKEHPDTKLIIQGHTDTTGSSAKNKKLSQMRANSLKAHLVEEGGINPERIEAEGYGDQMPIADNKTPEGRAENRRVIGVIVQ